MKLVKVTSTLEELRAAIEAEKERLERRPVPTTPWAMPLGLDDLLAFIEVVECAQELRATDHGSDGEIRAAQYLDKALDRFK